MPSVPDPSPARPVPPATHATPTPRATPALPLRVGCLRVTAPGGRIPLDVPRLALDVGTSLDIRGPFGAGKSTLLHTV